MFWLNFEKNRRLIRCTVQVLLINDKIFKITGDQLTEAKRRAEILSYAVQGEITHFDEERVREMTEFLGQFLKLQIAAHQKALASLNGALKAMVDQNLIS